MSLVPFLEGNFRVCPRSNYVKRSNTITHLYFRYEPTRYIIIGSHHDSMNKGAARPGIGHSVLMELIRTLGYEHRHGWRPGRSIVFASWDGKELVPFLIFRNNFN